MTVNRFNYYGYDRDTYYDCVDLIHTTNRKLMLILNSWFLLVNLLYLVFSGLNLFGVTQERIPFYTIYVVLAIVYDLIVLLFSAFVEKYNTLMVYVNIAIMLSYGILTSMAQPYMPATMFLVLLTIFSLSYIGKMYQMLFLSIVSCSIFLLTSFLYKTFSIAYHDMYNVCIVLILAIGLHYTFQRTRMQQFILYQRDLQIQRELEVKSSFDALTSLLNRGRFFSIAEEVLSYADDEYMVICLLDLDGFKEINDNLGHQMGDKAIQIAGKTILETLGIDLSEKWSFTEKAIKENVSFAGRLGGDEFIALIRGKSGQDEIIPLLIEMLASLNSVRFDGLDGIHASFGVTQLSAKDKDIDSAYKRADEALYASKRAGKNQIHFSEELQAV